MHISRLVLKPPLKAADAAARWHVHQRRNGAAPPHAFAVTDKPTYFPAHPRLVAPLSQGRQDANSHCRPRSRRPFCSTIRGRRSDLSGSRELHQHDLQPGIRKGEERGWFRKRSASPPRIVSAIRSGHSAQIADSIEFRHLIWMHRGQDSDCRLPKKREHLRQPTRGNAR
jgi:hypothetical protein